MRVDEIQILMDQGRIALNQGRFDEAAELIDRVLAEDAQNEQALNLKGLLLFKQDRFIEAVDLFGGLVNKYPEEPTLLMNLGLAYLKSEQYDQAVVELQKALDKQPNNPKVLNYMGLAHSGIGQLEKAQDYFLKGGSTKMADQMLQMMMEKSGEVIEDADIEVDVEDMDIGPEASPAVVETPSVEAGSSVEQPQEKNETVDATIEQPTPEPAGEETANIDQAFAETFAPSDQGSAPSDPVPVDADQAKSEPAATKPAQPPEPLPESAAPQAVPPESSAAPTDLLGSALGLLKDRYENVLETAAAGKNLLELSQLLKLAKDPNAKIDHIRPNLIRVSVSGEGASLTRMRGLLGLAGDVRAEPRQKRYKGKDINSIFGTESDPVYELVGAGAVYICAAEQQTFFPITLDGELVYIVEDAFSAMVGEWRWENGRLPGKNGNDLHLVQLRGNGMLAMRLQKGNQLGTIELQGQKLTLPANQLAGWYGNIVPVLVDLPLQSKQAQSAVQFQGDGTVILSVPGVS